MSKLSVLVGICIIILASCQKDNTSLTTSQLLSGKKITDQQLASTSIVDLNTGETTTALEFSQRGRPERDSACHKFPIDSLSKSITDYIATNYPGSTIEGARKDRSGDFKVIIKLADGTFKILEFDVTGVFVKEIQRKNPNGGPGGPGHGGHRGHGGDDHHLTQVDITSLLVVITDYISTNYAGWSIDRAGMAKDGDFIIAISMNGERKLLLFDANGAFIRVLR